MRTYRWALTRLSFYGYEIRGNENYIVYIYKDGDILYMDYSYPEYEGYLSFNLG